MDIKDRICSKITGWKAKLLSQAACTTLLKSMANANPTYLMSLFLIPKSFLLRNYCYYEEILVGFFPR
jgi:hypothetical protein